jgi:hypothetical protein
VVDEVMTDLESYVPSGETKPKRKVSGSQRDKLRLSIARLISDSVAIIWQRKRVEAASIDRNRNVYGMGNAYPDLGYTLHVERAFNGMVGLGLLKVTALGYYMRTPSAGSPRGKNTRYVATDQLLDMFTDEEQLVLPAIIPPHYPHPLIRVRIKEPDGTRGRAMAAEETDQSISMGSRVAYINSVLEQHWIDVGLPDEVIVEILKHHPGDEGDERQLNLNNRLLYRVFNSHDLSTGGRFYGPFWHNMPKALRPYLLIDGIPTVEVDYSNQHPTILYAMEREKPPLDAYDGVISHLGIEGHKAKNARGMIKKSFNAMLNALKPMKNSPDGVKPKDFGLKWREISDAIMAYHQPIAHHFYTGVGRRLQQMDSSIAERVLIQFARYGIPVLPVHDSFVVQEDYELVLRVVMNDEFIVVVERSPDLKLSKQQGSYLANSTELDLDAFDRLMKHKVPEHTSDDDVGHERRLRAFQQQTAFVVKN